MMIIDNLKETHQLIAIKEVIFLYTNSHLEYLLGYNLGDIHLTKINFIFPSFLGFYFPFRVEIY
jgi:hypothetical protein